MKQRLALAGALIHHPRVLLLDEPLTGVDPAGAKVIREMLLEFVNDGNAVVLTTHQLETVERLANRIGVIIGGRLIAHGTPDELRATAGMTGGTLEDAYLALIGDAARKAS